MTPEGGTRLVLVLTLSAALGLAVSADHQDRRLVPTGTADGGKRLAFVVGNDTYQQAPLKNARNDARVIAGVLRELGFDVTAIEDASRSTFGAALEKWARGLGASDLAVVYYAGHGVELDGQNYLVPVDYAGADAAMVKWEAVPAERIHEILQRARVGVLVLDACRNNPFAGKRGAGGLAAMEARGTLIAYATGAGQTASDNPSGTNGLFTQELAKVLRQPGLSLTEGFRAVRKAVYDATSGQQFPAVYDGLLGDVVLRPVAASPATPGPAGSSAELTAGEIVARHLAARGRLDKLEAATALRFSGRLRNESADLDLRFVVETKKPDRLRAEIHDGRAGVNEGATIGTDGSVAWRMVSGGAAEVVPIEEAKGITAGLSVLLNYAFVLTKLDGPVRLAGRETIDAMECYRLELAGKDGQPVRLDVTTTGYHLVRVSSGDLTVKLGNWNWVQGFLMPLLIEQSNGLRASYDQIEVDPAIDDSRFTMPVRTPAKFEVPPAALGAARVILEKSTDITAQQYRIFPAIGSLLEELGRDSAWKDGEFGITSVGSVNGGVAVVLSKMIRPFPQTISVEAEFPTKWVEDKWKEGYRVTEVAAVADRWVVVMGKDSGIGTQSLSTSPDWPVAFLQEKAKAGEYITVARWRGGTFVVVTSALEGGGALEQSWLVPETQAEFDAWTKYWGGQGFVLTHVVDAQQGRTFVITRYPSARERWALDRDPPGEGELAAFLAKGYWIVFLY